MSTIDSDAHVVECGRTWTYIDAKRRDLVPQPVELPTASGGTRRLWAIDDRLVATGPVSETDAVKAVREMEDVPARLKQMDEIGTDIQVLYPTVFLRPLTTSAEVEVAICQSYNRWLAERVEDARDRLKWVVVPPTLSVEAAKAEIRFGHENGASGVFWRGFEDGKLPSDPYFAPIFELMNDLGMPLCIHAANGSFALHDAFPTDGGIWRFKIPGIVAFSSILSSAMAKRYPNIRFAFIELQAQWVPYVLADFVRRRLRGGEELEPVRVMVENRLFVACQTDDDLDYIIGYTGGANLLAGTDFGHADTSSELLALQRLGQGYDVTAEQVRDILDANPRHLYDIAN